MKKNNASIFIVFLSWVILGSFWTSGQDQRLIQATKIAENLLGIEQGQIQLKPLSGGLTNHIFLVKGLAYDVSYVLRIVGDEALSLGVNPTRQAEIARKVGELGVGPKVIHLSDDKKQMLVEYVKGQILTPASYNAKIRDDLTKKLKKLHVQGDFKTTFDPFASAGLFKKATLQKQKNIFNYLPEEEIKRAGKIIEDIKNVIVQHSFRFMGSGHNDFHCGNILVGPDEKVVLIDWDYAGKSDIFFDLATLANSLNLATQGSDELLRSYFSYVSSNPRHEAHLGIMRMVSIYWNAMWYFSQVGSSEILHDHEKSAHSALADFLEKSESKSYANWMRTLKLMQPWLLDQALRTRFLA